MQIKINTGNLQIPGGGNETLLHRAQQFQSNDGQIDANEMLELVAEAEKGGMNADEQAFLAALKDKGVALAVGTRKVETEVLLFDVDESAQATHQAEVTALRKQLADDPGLAGRAMQANRAEQLAAVQRLDDKQKQKSAQAEAALDNLVSKYGTVNGDGRHYNAGKEQEIKEKANASAGLEATDDHCAAVWAQMHKDQGFKYPMNMGSTDKAAAFFVYKDFTAAPGKGLNPRFAEAQKADMAAGTGRQLFLLKDSAEGNMKTYMQSQPHNYSAYDADKNTYDWQHLPIRKGDMVLMRPKVKAPNGPEHAAMVKDYDPKTGIMIVIQGNPLAESSFDLTRPEDRAKFLAFGRPSPNDYH